MNEELRGNQEQQNIVVKTVSRMMGGSTAEGDQHPDIVVGQEYGRTPYSGEPEKASHWFTACRQPNSCMASRS